MSWESVKKPRRLGTAGSLSASLLVTVGSGAFVVPRLADAAQLARESVTVPATVLFVVGDEPGWDRLSSGRSVRVRFRTREGETVEASTSDFRFDPPPKPGDQTQVVYAAADPRIVEDARIGPNWFNLGLVYLLGGLVWAGMNVRAIRRAPSRAERTEALIRGHGVKLTRGQGAGNQPKARGRRRRHRRS